MPVLAVFFVLALGLSPNQAHAHDPDVGEKIGGVLLTAVSSIGYVGSLAWAIGLTPLQFSTCFQLPGRPGEIYLHQEYQRKWCQPLNVVTSGPMKLTESGFTKGVNMVKGTHHRHHRKNRHHRYRRGR